MNNLTLPTSLLSQILGGLPWHTSWWHPWGYLSKWQIHFYTPTNDNPMTISWFSPYLGGGIVGNLPPSIASYPTYTRVGVGGGAGWVLPCFPSLLMRGWGKGAGDNPYIWLNTYTSYAQCPRDSITKSKSYLILQYSYSRGFPFTNILYYKMFHL
jgi:hypothetical protein